MKKQRVPGIVTIAILTVITAIFWVVLDVYRALTTKPVPEVPAEILAPLNPNLDQQTLDKLQQRMYLEESELGTITLPTTTPEPTASPLPLEEESVTQEATEEASTQ